MTAQTPLERASTVLASLLGATSPAVRLVRGKLARNQALGVAPLLAKSLRFAATTVRSRVLLRAVNELGVGVRVDGLAPRIDNRGTIAIGDDVIFSAPVTAIFLGVERGAFLGIGADGWINDGVWFGCTERITVGRRALIGPGVRIFDNNYHGSYDRNRRPAARPVAIGDDVWLSSDVMVLPGVTIGRGAIIAGGAVVRDDVAPFAVVAGNPARVVKVLDPSRFVVRGPMPGAGWTS